MANATDGTRRRHAATARGGGTPRPALCSVPRARARREVGAAGTLYVVREEPWVKATPCRYRYHGIKAKAARGGCQCQHRVLRRAAQSRDATTEGRPGQGRVLSTSSRTAAGGEGPPRITTRATKYLHAAVQSQLASCRTGQNKQHDGWKRQFALRGSRLVAFSAEFQRFKGRGRGVP